MRILVTGGSGFIGSALIRRVLATTGHSVLNLDCLTYASTAGSVEDAQASGRYSFAKVDICDRSALEAAFAEYKPDVVAHLAAESHVDRSIDGPDDFVQTNVLGTFNLLESARLVGVSKFLHVSTDEVYGSLALTDTPATEDTPYDPRSPYSATKAASDHLVRAWGETYGLPTVTTNCSNNYGPYHFPEKLIPLMIINAMGGLPLPVYGNGANVRDWLFVEDHADALIAVLERGRTGETYNIGGDEERTNLQVVELVCDLVDEVVGSQAGDAPRQNLIQFVDDRPGHDLRYAIDASKIGHELGWAPTRTFEAGLRETVEWYVGNADWWRPLTDKRATDRRGLMNR